MNLKLSLKTAFAIAATLAATIATVSPANAAVWQPTAANSLDSSSYSITSEDSFTTTAGYSALYNDANDALCITLGQGSCAAATTGSFSGTYILPICESATQILCLEGVNIYKQGSSAAAATFMRQVDAPVTAVVAGSKLPKGGATALFNAPTAPNASGATTYAVAVEADVAIKKGVVTATGFTAVVKPYSLVTDPYTRASKITGIGANAAIEDNSDSKCAFTENGVCGELQDFTLDTRVGVAFRIGKAANTFYSARVKAPVLAVTKAAATNYLKVSLNAQPVAVQGLSIKLPTTNVPAGLTIGSAPKAKTDYTLGGTADVNALRAITGNKPTGVRTMWAFTNQDSTVVDLGTKTACVASNGVKGLIATDALIADSFNPVKASGVVKQTINSFGSNWDSTPTLGNWDLVLANDYARCAFGLAKTGAIKVKPTVAAVAKGAGFAATGTSNASWATASVRNIKFTGSTVVSVAVTK